MRPSIWMSWLRCCTEPIIAKNPIFRKILTMVRMAMVMALLSNLAQATPSFAAARDSVWWGRTTGKMPYMEYGIGDDRLGGAKMGLLDSNVLVKVVDSFQTQYKIQLSKYHS